MALGKLLHFFFFKTEIKISCHFSWRWNKIYSFIYAQQGMRKTFRIMPGACLVNVLSSLKAHVVLSCFFFLIYFWQHSSLLLRSGFLWFRSWEGSSLLQCTACPCGTFSSCGAWALGRAGLSRCGSQAVACGLSGFGTWARLLSSMWDLPGPGIEPVSPASASGILFTIPPGKSPTWSWRRYGRAYPPVKEKVELSLFGTLWEAFSPETGL